MSIYASRPRRIAGQLAADLFVLVWTVCWFIAGRVVDATVRGVADPVRAMSASVGQVRNDLAQAADTAGEVPGLGPALRGPFDAATTNLGDVADAADRQVQAIEQAATILGMLCFLLPVLGAVACWLPLRIRFHRANAAARQLVASGAGNDLFALRALARQPLATLARIDSDPVGAWRTGNIRVINELAAIELKRAGLSATRNSTTSNAVPGDKDSPAAR